MTERENLLIDPYLFQRPPAGEWAQATKAILAWGSADLRESVEFIFSDSVTKLMETGRLPYLNHLEVGAGLRADGEHWAASVDVCRLATQMLQEGCFLEVRAICGDIMSDPADVVGRLDEAIQGGFCEWVIALKANEIGEGQPPCECLASLRGGPVVEGHELIVKGQLELFEGPAESVVTVPAAVTASVQVLVEPPRIDLDPKSLVSDPIGLLKAAYTVIVPEGDRGRYPLRSFSVGHKFIESIHSHNLQDNRELLQIIIKQALRLLSGQEARFAKSLEIHPQRVGPGPEDAPVVRRDGAELKRLTLTVHKEGYRLLYWKRGDWYELEEVRTESE